MPDVAVFIVREPVEEPLEGDAEYRLFIHRFLTILMDEGGEQHVVGRELIIADDLEVFAFIEAVVYRPTFPLRATSVMAPGMVFLSIYRCIAVFMRLSRADDIPTVPGFAIGNPIVFGVPLFTVFGDLDALAITSLLSLP